MTDLHSPPPPPPAGQKHFWTELNVSAASLAIANSVAQHQNTSLLITASVAEAERLHQELSIFANASLREKLRVFPDWETLPYDSFSPHQDIISDRLRCLYDLSFKQGSVVITSAQTMLQRLLPHNYLKTKSLHVEINEKLERDRFFASLIESGYARVDTVFQHGEFAVRGAIIDIFPMGSEVAYRIEYFDDEIDSLRQFDPETQRTIAPVQKVELLPGRECPLDPEGIARFRDNWHREFDVDHKACPVYEDVCSGLAPGGLEYFSTLFFDESSTLVQYLPSDAVVYTLGSYDQALETHWREIQSRYESRSGDLRRPILSPEKVFVPVNELFGTLKSFPRIEISEARREQKSGEQVFNTGQLPLISIDSKANQPLHRVAELIAKTDKRLLFCAESEGRREIIKEHLSSIDIRPDEVCDIQDFIDTDTPLGICVADISHSVVSTNPNLAIISESALFSRRIQQARRRKKATDDISNAVKDLTELKIGAAVVHIEHGVGRYRGLETIIHGGQKEEFLALEYANEAKLYVPVANLYLISRYSGTEESLAPLHKLGNDQWSKAKRKAAEQVRDVAAELLNIYAQRKARQGHSHDIDQRSYALFSDEFPFEETPDQIAAIEAVRADMLATQPMDRLVCGDVGFGKTEVAMRAAFIAVQNSKQVAVLVPTTLLAQQHYDNFKDRFANWPVTIDVLSRFRTGKESTRAIEHIASGKTDIIIGTHKLISGDMDFKNLGLVIIDEEHRFGVRQKEKFKSLRAEIDILNLTATPIPRTLNMAMSGIRDLSIIATPPAKRLSVKTFVRERDPNMIREAVLRELMRGGQVYYLHNEVKDIERVAGELKELIPEARIEIGHGQMRERELEAVMTDFYHKRFNILVCTTIIETGIDVPSANTIIIDRADKFGLAQLHQLRGRVGRSHHQAYAYLLSPNRKNITADAVKRLEAIEDTQELGAGFSLASHDLEIRGAGELLGDEQSGQMQAIGFTLYMDMLDRAVSALKNNEQIDLDAPLQTETEINLRIPALIPDDYLPDVSLRLSLYKRISSIKTEAELESLQVEMIDRFGLLPEPIKNLFRVTQMRFLADRLGVTKIEASAKGGKVEFGKKTTVDPLAIVKLVQKQPQHYKLKGANHLQFLIETDSADTRLKTVHTLLTRLQEAS